MIKKRAGWYYTELLPKLVTALEDSNLKYNPDSKEERMWKLAIFLLKLGVEPREV